VGLKNEWCGDENGVAMKTDQLFYELFKIDSRSLFRLVQLEVEGEYTFESFTIKTTEKRLDGFCKRIDGIGPNVFVEIQGYPDSKIYWRALRELGTYYEQNEDTAPFVLIVLFLDEKYDPGNCPLSQIAPPHQLIRAYLIDCLDAVWKEAGVLTVLKPLALSRKEQAFEHIREWKAEIQALPLPAEKLQILIGLFEYLIIQRFPTINRKEVETMLQLTPIEETVIGRELIQIGKQEGQQEGIKEGEKKGLTKGELIGEIRATQRFLKQPATPVARLARKSLKTLKTLLQELETELGQGHAVQER
jgi:predicted transposase YdaD